MVLPPVCSSVEVNLKKIEIYEHGSPNKSCNTDELSGLLQVFVKSFEKLTTFTVFHWSFLQPCLPTHGLASRVVSRARA